MTLPQQIAQLCQLIHIFETDVRPIKEQLFSINGLTPSLIWNSIINAKNTTARPQQLINYFNKHGLAVHKGDMELLVSVYSSRKDGQLSQGDLWQIFRPLHMRAVSDVLAVRKKRSVQAQCHEVHYKVTDMLSKIIDKTLSFLKVAEKMKKNIVRCHSQQVQIRPLDAAHLQIYVNPWAEGLMRSDLEIVMQHIMRNELWCSKTFWEFMIPIRIKGSGVNPNHQQKDEVDSREGIIQHCKKVEYVKSSLKKKPLYFLNDGLKN